MCSAERAGVPDGACARLAELGVAAVYEGGGQRGLIDADLLQIVPGSRVAGPARTVRCLQDDNLGMHAVLPLVRPGDVLVITMPDAVPVGLVGDLLATQAKVAGAAAILVDGAVRDAEELRALGLPIWARWVRVRAAGKRGRGTLGGPVAVGGARIEEGDVVVLDGDGGVVVAAADVATTLAGAEARCAREGELRARYEAGAFSWNLLGLDGGDSDRAG